MTHFGMAQGGELKTSHQLLVSGEDNKRNMNGISNETPLRSETKLTTRHSEAYRSSTFRSHASDLVKWGSGSLKQPVTRGEAVWTVLYRS